MKKLFCLCAALLVLFAGCGKATPANAPTDFTSVPSTANQTTPQENGQEYRAMWISYLELNSLKGADETTFRQQAGQMVENCKQLGLNTIIFQVRPFGDALYSSQLFPQSHILSGTQGQDIGYDPLQIFIEETHQRGMKLEAWVNPYRIQLNSNQPASLAANNPAVQHPEWAVSANGGLYYNPALPEVQQLVVDGVKEIITNYDVDGIHFDDYFYPTTEESFDADTYAQMGQGMSLADWRRQNVNQLVKKVYTTIKETDSSIRFGISPQGNNANNYDQQYSDVCLWLKEPGYVDYIMPQLYWGFGYLTSSGRTEYQFANLCKQWADYPRDQAVSLYMGLGAWRIGEGDGGANDQAEWSSGNNLAKMVSTLRETGCTGFALYRYDSLYASSYADLAAVEASALAEVLQ